MSASPLITILAGAALAAGLAASPALPRLAAALTAAGTPPAVTSLCLAGHCWTLVSGGSGSPPAWVLAAAAFAAGVVAAWLSSRSSPTYLVDFAVFRPPDNLKCTKAVFCKAIDGIAEYTEEARDFMRKIIDTSGVGEDAAMPAIMHAPPPWKITMEACREEAEMIMFDIVQQALVKTGLKATDIDVLIVNCSIFCPTPSLSAMIVNRFKLRPDCVTYNLGGMGCSASPIAVDLARELLARRRRARALVVSTENITHNLYTGNYRPMLIAGCIFRLGGAAIVLSNHPADARRSKYDLHFVARTNAAGNDDGYSAVYQCEDSDSVIGVRLSKNLMKVAGATLRANITRIGPLVLPLSEQAKFAVNLVRRKVGFLDGVWGDDVWSEREEKTSKPHDTHTFPPTHTQTTDPAPPAQTLRPRLHARL